MSTKVIRLYSSLFSTQEIETSKAVQWSLAISILSFFISFETWSATSSVSVSLYETGKHLCWPHFQDCGKWYFLQNYPWGYSQGIVYMVFFGLMLLGGYYIYKKNWLAAHLSVLILFLWKALYISIFTLSASNNYDFYHLVFTFVVLFLPYKEFFLQLTATLLYFLSSTIKIHEGWIVGTLFSTFRDGLPIFNVLGQDAIPLITNSVIAFQVVFCWFLMSSNKLYQKMAFTYSVLYHLYSGTLVGYHYPSMVMPELIVMFGLFYRKLEVPLTVKSITGWLLIIIMFILQSISILIPGDTKLTLEGNPYGLYMFEANHQCIIETVVHKKDGTTSTTTQESMRSMDRCDPYYYYFFAKQLCQRDKNVVSVEMRMDHSINGHPFYRIVDEKDMCIINYKPFRHNKWIKTVEEGAVDVGLPFKNFYNY